MKGFMMLRNRILSAILSLCLLAGAALPAHAEEADATPSPAEDVLLSEDLQDPLCRSCGNRTP